MRPRNKFDVLIISLNKKVKPVNQKAIDWTLKKILRHPAFRSKKGMVVCGCCGKPFQFYPKGKQLNCPHCHSMIEFLDGLKRTYKSATYFSTMEIIKGIQVMRTFHIKVSYRKGETLESLVREVCRNWINSNGHTTLTGLRRTMGYYLDSFNWGSKIELRETSNVFHHITDTFVYPRYRLIPELKRNGLKNLNMGLHPFDLMKKTLKDSRIETLLKSGNTKVLTHFFEHPNHLDLCWNSYKIALRHGYEINDIQLWCDLIQLLDKCGKDIRSTKYICPFDLQAEHNRWHRRVLRLNEIENRQRNLKWERERLEREKEKMERVLTRESEYVKNKGCYFDIVIKDKDLEISVLDSIRAFLEEGTAMHHCVFSNSYYDKPDSIILSAHYSDGTRIETVEYSLTHHKVIQCRGAYNQNTSLHDRIIDLLNSNAYRFIEAQAKTA